jgi:hypothetical protein
VADEIRDKFKVLASQKGLSESALFTKIVSKQKLAVSTSPIVFDNEGYSPNDGKLIDLTNGVKLICQLRKKNGSTVCLGVGVQVIKFGHGDSNVICYACMRHINLAKNGEEPILRAGAHPKLGGLATE